MKLAGVAPLFALAACAATTPAPQTPGNPESLCHAESLGSFIGQTATADLGAKLLAASGARVLRWAPPRTAVTMDYRPDRLTVSYDDAMAIIRLGCG